MKNKTLVFNNRYPQKTWTINLRRLVGKPIVKSVNDYTGKKLGHWSQIIGDKLIVELKDGPNIGQMKILFKGEKALYVYKQSWWGKVKSFFSKLFRRKS